MFISKGVIRSLSLTIKFPSETCGGRRLSTRKKGVVRLLQSLEVNYRGRCGGG